METVCLDCTFAELLEESIELTSLNQFETYWEIIPDRSVLLDQEHKSNNRCIQFGSLYVKIQILFHTLGIFRPYSKGLRYPYHR